MYMPSRFARDDLSLARQAIAQYPLALLVGPDTEQRMFGTHVPLTAMDSAEGWCLEGHMARANPHWHWLSQQSSVLAVFNGPGAYVSPRHYEDRRNVPTWNYVAVHVQGTLTLVDEPQEKDHLLKRLIAQHEPEYAAQWRDLPVDFQQQLLGAIVGFRVQVTQWEGKFKLSQNRSAVERQRIQLAQTQGTAFEQDLARWMSRLGL